MTKRRHYNLVFLYARRKTFPAFTDIAAVLPEVWPWGDMAPVSEVASRLAHQFPVDLVEAVSERLASVQAEITQVVTLADPVPDADDARPIRILPVRTMRKEERS